MARIVRFALSFGLLVAQIQSSAAKDALCFGVPVLDVDPAMEPRLKVVAFGADRVPFVKGSDSAANCSDTSAACAAKAFVVAADPIVAATAWAGTWRSGDEKQIAIRGESGNRIVISGDATFGGDDPARVQCGAVNSGQLSAMASIANGIAAFAVDDDGSTKPFDVKLPNDGDICRVKLWRLGSYLVAADNVRCGGMNVTFTGVYRRAGS